MIKQFIKTLSILSIILIGSNTAFASTNFILDTSNQSNIYPIGTSPHGIGICTSSNGTSCTGTIIQTTGTNANGDFVDNIFNQNQAPNSIFPNPVGYLCINDIQGDGSNFYILYLQQGFNVVGSSNVKVVNGVCENVQVTTPPGETATSTPFNLSLTDLIASVGQVSTTATAGVLPYMVVMFGFPLSFYVIRKVLALVYIKK